MKITTCSISRRDPAVTRELPSRTARAVPSSNIMVIDDEVVDRRKERKRGGEEGKKSRKQGKQSPSLRPHQFGAHRDEPT
jgi:hypothetical protein